MDVICNPSQSVTTLTAGQEPFQGEGSSADPTPKPAPIMPLAPWDNPTSVSHQQALRKSNQYSSSSGVEPSIITLASTKESISTDYDEILTEAWGPDTFVLPSAEGDNAESAKSEEIDQKAAEQSVEVLTAAGSISLQSSVETLENEWEVRKTWTTWVRMRNYLSVPKVVESEKEELTKLLEESQMDESEKERKMGKASKSKKKTFPAVKSKRNHSHKKSTPSKTESLATGKDNAQPKNAGITLSKLDDIFPMTTSAAQNCLAVFEKELHAQDGVVNKPPGALLTRPDQESTYDALKRLRDGLDRLLKEGREWKGNSALNDRTVILDTKLKRIPSAHSSAETVDGDAHTAGFADDEESGSSADSGEETSSEESDDETDIENYKEFGGNKVKKREELKEIETVLKGLLGQLEGLTGGE